jgi:hypothetical protein
MIAELAAVVALIVPQHGIHGVSLSMSHRAVTNRLSKATQVKRIDAGAGPEQLAIFPHVRVWFGPGMGVIQIETTSPVDRTASGVGIGSTEVQLRAGVKGLACATESGIRHCHLGTYTAGHVVTDFFVRRGRVYRIVVGRVLD